MSQPSPAKNGVFDQGAPGRAGVARLALLFACLLLAFGLRVFALDGQSFWSDEGASMTMAGRTVSQILTAAAADIHPPLYYILLHWWSLPVGTSEFALRFLSVGCGLSLVALVFRLGERFFGTAVGLAAAFVAATAPFLVYYSQEARMYAPMAFLTTLSTYLALVLLGRAGSSRRDARRQPILWVVYVLVTAAAMYTQYFAFSVVVFQNIWFVLHRAHHWREGIRRQARLWAAWLAAQLAVVLLYLPWLLQSMRQLAGWPSISESFGLLTLARRVFLVFSFGISWDMTATGKTGLLTIAALAASLLVLIVPLLPAGRRLDGVDSDRAPGSWTSAAASYAFVVLYLAAPVLAMYLLSLQRPMYNPKFMLLAAPPYYLLLGLGVVTAGWIVGWAVREIGRRLAARGRQLLGRRRSRGERSMLKMGTLPWPRLATAVVVVAMLGGMSYATSRSLNAYYFNPKYARDDYRGLARVITLSEHDQDAIILNAPGQQEIFGYYYHGARPVIPLPKQRPIDEAVTAADLQQIATAHDRIWLVLWAVNESDPRRFIEGWLDEHAFKTDTRWFGSVRLVLYTLSGGDAGIQHPLDATFGRGIRLLGYSLGGEQGGAASAGQVLPLTLFWQALQPIETRYTVFTHLIDGHEHIWGQRDSEPGGGAKLTTTWPVGEVITDNYGLPVYLGTPPGDYQVEIGLYSPADGRRLTIQDGAGQFLGDRLLLGPVRLARPAQPPDIAALFVEHALDSTFGPLRLVGFDFHKLGFDRGAVDFKDGDIAHLALYWQAPEKPGSGYTILLQLVDKNGRVVFSREGAPVEGNYPTAQWERGEVVRDQHKIPLDLSAGQYRLTVGLKRYGAVVKTGSEVLLTLTSFTVQGR